VFGPNDESDTSGLSCGMGSKVRHGPSSD